MGGARCSEIVDIPSWKWRLKEQDAHHSSIPTHRRGVFETNVGQAPNASRCDHFIKQKVKMASRALNSAGHNGNTSGEATFLALVPSARRQRVLLHTGTRPRNPPRTDSALLLISLIQSAFLCCFAASTYRVFCFRLCVPSQPGSKLFQPHFQPVNIVWLRLPPVTCSGFFLMDKG